VTKNLRVKQPPSNHEDINLNKYLIFFMCSKKKKNSNEQNFILANLSKHIYIIANRKKNSYGQN